MKKSRWLIFFAFLVLIPSVYGQGRHRYGTRVNTKVPGLTVYHPAGIPRMAFDTMPAADTSITICCEAAYTDKIKKTFAHTNVCGDHVLDRTRHTGARCDANTGGFVYYDGTWAFLAGNISAELDSAALRRDGIGFGQALIIYDGQFVKQSRALSLKTKEFYRALCEKDGELLIVDTKEKVTYGRFLYMLAQYGVKNAIYLDMGSGWNHSFYRDERGRRHDIFPKGHDYCTNWLYFTTSANPFPPEPIAEPASMLADNYDAEGFIESAALEPDEYEAPAPKPQKAAAQEEQKSYYTVKSGDTLGRIAKKHHTTVAKLCKLNNMRENATLQVGKKLRVK